MPSQIVPAIRVVQLRYGISPSPMPAARPEKIVERMHMVATIRPPITNRRPMSVSAVA